jgi:hypothetical protein
METGGPDIPGRWAVGCDTTICPRSRTLISLVNAFMSCNSGARAARPNRPIRIPCTICSPAPPAGDSLERHLPAHRERFYTTARTLSMFVGQALRADDSCREAVAAAAANRLLEGAAIGSADTGSYCKARARLPLATLAGLTRELGEALGAGAPQDQQWRVQRICLVDNALTAPGRKQRNICVDISGG